ncbi:MAG: GreA/GreB family elongation factor [Patescibacteria group bacterium]|nr:GreA/GreB family elongation factor [Patescibacteria group bacterium]
MRTPIRKAGKYNRTKMDPHLSLTRYKSLKSKIKRLKAFNQPQIIKEVKLLAQDGDFSDNAAYSIAKGRLRGLNQYIAETEDLLRRAIIIEPSTSSKVVKIGSQVKLEVNKKIKAYQILGPSEADPAHGIISYQSPLAKALIDQKLGATIELKNKNKTIYYKIIEIL